MRRSRKRSQLDASWKYKQGLRKDGIPLRDDLARAAFLRVLEELSVRLEKGEEAKLENGINAFMRYLPERFDREKAHERVRSLVGKTMVSRLEAKGATDSDL